MAIVDTTVLDQLQSHGLRRTGPRRAVAEAALQRHGRFTANDLVDELRPDGIGRATVFRTLDLLAELGVLERLHTDSHHAYTVCSPQHHHHLVCAGCDSVQEIVSPAAERLVQVVTEQAGYRLLGHLLEIQGLCPRCQAEGKQPSQEHAHDHAAD